jgi:glycosyltransferase involved in cell wall biosynthesis
MESNLPLVSVIIPNFNYANYVCDAIQSVIGQSYRNLEIIVVDDGSTDNSVDLITNSYPNIKFLVKENGGVSTARNLGIRESTGEYVCFLDSDDVWNLNKISLQVEVALAKNSSFVYSGYTECDSILNPLRDFAPKHEGDCEIHYRLKPTSAIALLGTSTALISRGVVNEIGFFDPRLKTSADWDFMRRVSKIADFDFVPKSLVLYRRHTENMSSSTLEIYYKDNEFAVKKMLNEYRNAGIKNFFINRLSSAKFHYGALKAFAKAGNLIQSAKHMRKLFWGLINY